MAPITRVSAICQAGVISASNHSPVSLVALSSVESGSVAVSTRGSVSRNERGARMASRVVGASPRPAGALWK